MEKNGKDFDRGDLARAIAAAYGDQLLDTEGPEQMALIVLGAIAELIPQAVSEFGHVEIHNFGTFNLKNDMVFVGRSDTGVPDFVPSGSNKVKFKAAPKLLERISSLTGRPTE